MSRAVAIPEEVILSRIFFIRNQKVMIDRDLAKLYGVETRVLNQAVKRNITRFPKDFMFEMTAKEFKDWTSQIVMSDSDRVGLRRKPFCFTEEGVTMLSCVLNSPRAVAVNIRVIRVFAKMRNMLLTNRDILLKLEKMEKQLSKNSSDVEMIFEALRELLSHPEPKRKRIGFKHYDE